MHEFVLFGFLSVKWMYATQRTSWPADAAVWLAVKCCLLGDRAAAPYLSQEAKRMTRSPRSLKTFVFQRSHHYLVTKVGCGCEYRSIQYQQTRRAFLSRMDLHFYQNILFKLPVVWSGTLHTLLFFDLSDKSIHPSVSLHHLPLMRMIFCHFPTQCASSKAALPTGNANSVCFSAWEVTQIFQWGPAVELTHILSVWTVIAFDELLLFVIWIVGSLKVEQFWSFHLCPCVWLSLSAMLCCISPWWRWKATWRAALCQRKASVNI